MNRFNRFEYTDEDYIFSGNHNKSNVAQLSSTLQSVSNEFDHAEYYINKAKINCWFPSVNCLSQDESAALYLFLDVSEDKSLHSVLNEILRTRNQKALQPWQDFLGLLYQALKKLPTIKQKIWRGIPLNVAKKLEKNQEIVLCCITSCSSSKDVMKSLIEKDSILCSIEPLNGKDVQNYSSTVGDGEVLLLPGTRLRVKDKKRNGKKGEPLIIFEEITEVNDEEEISNEIGIVPHKEAADEQDRDANYGSTLPNMSTHQADNETPSSQSKSSNEEVKAVITFSDGDQYKLIYKDGNRQIDGTYFSVNGEKFHGEHAIGKANGEGILAFENNIRFIGTFQLGKRHGHGIFYHSDGTIEAGEWSDDEQTDQIFQKKSNGISHKWQNSKHKIHPYQVYDDEHGNKYIGKVDNGKAHGLGIRIWSDKCRYEGNFMNDKKHGFGIYYNSNQDAYVGQWTNDEMDGNGQLTWTSGSYYEGKFNRSKRDGEGKLIFPNGLKLEGVWKNDQYLS